jgi:hypothetical protein
MFEAGRMPNESPVSSARKPEARSRITNGRELLANIDGRSTEARRYRDLCFSFADDCGGARSLTEAQRALVRQRLVWLSRASDWQVRQFAASSSATSNRPASLMPWGGR